MFRSCTFGVKNLESWVAYSQTQDASYYGHQFARPLEASPSGHVRVEVP